MIRVVLFDRDGTLIADRSARLTLMPGAATIVARLRERGLRVGVVTNQPQSGTSEQAHRAMLALHQRIEARIGALDGWFVCPHAPDAGCMCRKPRPGLIHEALAAFGASPDECIVIGDIGSDMQAAAAAGAHAIMVPTAVTRTQEIEAAPLVCANLLEALDVVLGQAVA